MKNKITAAVIVLSFAMMALGCSALKPATKHEKVMAYTTEAINITNKIWAAANSPEMGLVLVITPVSWDDELRNKTRLYLQAIMPYVGIVDECKEKDLEATFICIIHKLRKQPEVQRNENLQKLTAILTLAQQLYCKK